MRDKVNKNYQVLKRFKEADSTEAELNFITKLGHENVMGIKDIFKDENGCICYTMDFAWHGDLYYKIIEYSIIDKKFND